MLRFYLIGGESIKRTDIVLGSTEPANYRGSYNAQWKEILDIETTMHRNVSFL
jgi:hypothetical protein